MQLKYDPRQLFFSQVLLLESEGKMVWSLTSTSPALKKYEILIEIKDSDESFKINADAEFNILLLRGSGTASWRIQNPNELDINENLLGQVVVKKEGTVKREFHKFDLFYDEKRIENGAKNRGGIE